MAKPAHLRPSDLSGLNRLVIDAILGMTDVVEAAHHDIASGARVSGDRTRGITGLVYRSIRGVRRIAGGGVGALLAVVERLGPKNPEETSSREREAVIAALN